MLKMIKESTGDESVKLAWITAKTAGTVLIAGLLLVLTALTPLIVFAATSTEGTTVSAEIASVISMETSGTVNITVTPTDAGPQSSASDTVSVSTNHSAGYTLKLSDADDDTKLVSGANSIYAFFDQPGGEPWSMASAGTAWGFAVAGLPGFDSSYASFTNEAGHASRWLGMRTHSSGGYTIKTTASTAADDPTTVWYSVKASLPTPNGTYTDTVTYTATTN